MPSPLVGFKPYRILYQNIFGGRLYDVQIFQFIRSQIQSPTTRRLMVASQTMAIEVKAHITGTVWKIEVKEGDEVEEGDVIAILESMKMEMPVETDDDGTVEKIHVTEGQAIKEGELIATLSD